MRRPLGSERSGFTIIEVILALGIMMIGMSVILTLMTFGAGMSRDADLRADSAATARAIVADLEEGFFPIGADDVIGAPVDIESRTLPGYPGLVYSAHATLNPTRTGDLGLADTPGAVLDNGPLEYRVDVRVSWMSRGESRGSMFSVLLTRELPFGARLRRLFVDSDRN